MDDLVAFGEWHRLFFGREPNAFLLEVLVRTTLIYLVLLVVARLLGKRMSGQISNLELAVMVALGAIVSAPMQMQERGLLGALVLLLVLLGLQRGLGALTARYMRLELLAFGRGTVLVRDGELVVSAMQQARVSQEQLLALLREQDVKQLGEVKRVYLEATGAFSVLRQEPPRPGLSIIPRTDEALQRALPRADVECCTYCGHLAGDRKPSACPMCAHDDWVRAIEPADPAAHGGDAKPSASRRSA